MSFRIGRKHAQHTYPEPRGSGTTPFARNFAYSQEGQNQPIPQDPAEVAVIWDPISSGAPAGTNVPITPVSTGIIRILAVISVGKTVADGTVTITIHVNGVEIEPPESFRAEIDVDGFAAIPVLAEVSGLPLGVVANIQIFATSSGVGAELIEESSSIEVQEVQAATG